MSGPVVASAPGKIILMGEHAVVYGRPALVAALGPRARARLSAASDLGAGAVELRLPDLDVRTVTSREELRAVADRARERWRRRRAGARGGEEASEPDDPARLVEVAVGESMRLAPGPADAPGVRLEVSSDLPVGCGLGSSAAVGAAVSGAWLAWHGTSPGEEERERLLLEIERRQHGSPSGVDGATVLRGGVLWAERGDGGQLEVGPAGFGPDRLPPLRLVDTGRPAEDTGAVVAAVRRRREEEPERVSAALERIDSATRRFRLVLAGSGASPDEVRDLIRSCQRGLEELGVVPSPARRLVRRIEERGGAAKISGAGALTSPSDGRPGAGVLLVHHPEPRRIEEWDVFRELEVRDVAVGAEGARVEEPG